MSGDQFKDVGQYIEEDEYLELPGGDLGPACTVEGWFIWMEGDGPLFTSADDDWQFVYDRDGRCAYRVGGVERVTTLRVAPLRNHWTYLAVAKGEEDVILRVNESTADRWEEAPVAAGLSAPWFVMKGASGFAADIAGYDRRVPDDRLDAHWLAGKNRV
jgi:hypothetical protein